MDELFSLFDELPESHRKLILETPSLLDAFCAEASAKIGIDIEEVKAHLSKMGAFVQGEAERVVRLSESFDAVKDKSLRLIEKQTERELWYQELILNPLAIAYAVRELIDDGMDFSSALEKVNSQDYEPDLSMIRNRLGKTPDLSSLVMKPKFIRWDDGSTQSHREKKARIYHEVLTLLKDCGESLTKTQILRRLGKDNSSWRGITAEVLKYMVSREIIVMRGNKFIHSSKYHNREHSYHRAVYELLCDSPHSQTSILKQMGYNNQKGRKKLQKALELMLIEGLVDTDGKRWFVP